MILSDKCAPEVFQAKAESTASTSILCSHYLSTPLFWILQCGGWLAFGVAMFAWGLDYFNPRDAFVNKAILVITGFGVSLILRSLYRRTRERSRTPLTSALLIFSLSFSGAAIWREIQNLLLVGTRRLELLTSTVSKPVIDSKGVNNRRNRQNRDTRRNLLSNCYQKHGKWVWGRIVGDRPVTVALEHLDRYIMSTTVNEILWTYAAQRVT